MVMVILGLKTKALEDNATKTNALYARSHICCVVLAVSTGKTSTAIHTL